MHFPGALARIIPLASVFLVTLPALLAPTSAFGTEAAWLSRVTDLDQGDRIELSVSLDGRRSDADTTLALQRFKPYLPSATIEVDGGPMALPQRLEQRIYLQGQLNDDPTSRATVIVDRDGATRGLLELQGRMMALAEGGGSSIAFSELAETRNTRDFTCGNAQFKDMQDAVPAVPDSGKAPRLSGTDSEYLATIALETDYEYYQLFNDTMDALIYAVDLVAFSSTIYSHEVRTAIALDHISLWTDPGAEPWVETTTACQLFEFGEHWNSNRDDIDRTIAHFLSGKSAGGGVAWIGVLCQDEFQFNASNYGCSTVSGAGAYGGAYAVSANLEGVFDARQPESVWDIVVFSHEMGHNFNSPHTHCYGGIGGNGEPIDKCYSGECYVGTEALPGPAGEGSGTIMSYCHLKNPGISNISLTLGEDHDYGIAPARAPNRMANHVVNASAAFPGCIALPADSIFDDLFEFEQP
ncbi:MAG: hypothetical protein GVY11_02480 [Gammaproteobacteria bacterium]|jgi:hypothetical protein|nr:hypothetical protein [Gammaproteobacteria bacterium]